MMIIGHYKVHPGKAARFEEVVADDIRNTGREPGNVRFELWRGSEPNTYYVTASWFDENAFAFHNATPYHDRLAVLEREDVIQEARWEWVDPVAAAHAKFPPTAPSDAPLPPDASDYVKEWKAKVGPVREASWWAELRRRYAQSGAACANPP
jgi:quinol monooxygenase YgiN